MLKLIETYLVIITGIVSISCSCLRYNLETDFRNADNVTFGKVASIDTFSIPDSSMIKEFIDNGEDISTYDPKLFHYEIKRVEIEV